MRDIMRWKYAYKYLQSVVPQQDYPNISIWLYLSSDDGDEDSCENIQRVKWAIDQDGYADYSHIVVDSDNLMNLDGDAHASMFSETAYERWSKYLSQHKRGYSLKYQGIRGKPKACYTCPKTNGWAACHVFWMLPQQESREITHKYLLTSIQVI